MPLPKDEANPTEATDDEYYNGRGAVPGIVPNGSLVNHEDRQNSSAENEYGAGVVEVSQRNLDEQLVVVWPDEKEDNGRNGCTWAAVKN